MLAMALYPKVPLPFVVPTMDNCPTPNAFVEVFPRDIPVEGRLPLRFRIPCVPVDSAFRASVLLHNYQTTTLATTIPTVQVEPVALVATEPIPTTNVVLKGW